MSFLFDRQIEDGWRLLKALWDKPLGAAWIRGEPSEDFYLFLVYGGVLTSQKYKEIHEVMKSLGDLWIDRFRIKIVAASSAEGRFIVEYNRASPIYNSDNYGVAYVYRDALIIPKRVL